MKILLYLFLNIPLAVLSQANNDFGSINGKIITADTQAAQYVSVSVNNTRRGTITDARGKFELNKIKPGIYKISISLSGYTASTVVVEVKSNETTSLNLQLNRTYAELQQVIVKATYNPAYLETKEPESLRLNLPPVEIPQNIEVTSQQLLLDQGLLSMSEAIRNISGVQKTSGGLNDYALIIRGTDATNNVFRNGIGGYWWNQQEDIAMLERIEFIKGPAGFMVSFAEPGGLVNNITKQPGKNPIATINGGFGSYNLKRLTADFGGPIAKSQKLFYRLNAGIHYQDRVFQFSNASRYFVCAALKYDLDKATSITAEYNYMRGETSGNNESLPSIDGKLFSLPRNFPVANAGTDKLVAADQYYRLFMTHKFNEKWSLSSQVAYVHGLSQGHLLYSDDDVPVVNDTLFRVSDFIDWHNFTKVAQLFIDGSFNTGPSVENKILAGIDFANAGVTNREGGTWGESKYGIYIPHPSYKVTRDSLNNLQLPDATSWKWQWATLYLEDHIKIGKRLSLTLATHVTTAYLKIAGPDIPDNQKKTNYNIFMPRIGLTFLISTNSSLYAIYDKSFWPQWGDNIFDKRPVKPLTGSNIETGSKNYFIHKRLGIDISLYDITKNNVLSPDPIHPNKFIESGQIQSKGIDVDLTGNVSSSLAINANYEYANARITKDEDANRIGLKNPGTPDNDINIWLKYTAQKGDIKNLSFALGYQYMGRRGAAFNWQPGDDMKFLPTYNLFDAAISYHKTGWNVTLNIYNLTNINYATLGFFNSAINEWRYTPGEPINFRVSFCVDLVKKEKKSSPISN